MLLGRIWCKGKCRAASRPQQASGHEIKKGHKKMEGIVLTSLRTHALDSKEAEALEYCAHKQILVNLCNCDHGVVVCGGS